MLMKTHVLRDTYEACAGGLAQCLFILWLIIMAVIIERMLRRKDIKQNGDEDDNNDDPYKFA
jgi:hypothetical protein